MSPTHRLRLVSLSALSFLLLVWVAVTVPIVRRFRAQVSRRDEVRGG